MKFLYKFITALAIVVLLLSCATLTGKTRNPFFIQEGDPSILRMDGDIGSTTLDHFNTVYEEYPSIKTLSIIYCGGSVDDDANFLLMERIYDLGIGTHLEEDAEIASGGVDLFLAGVTRTRAKWGVSKGMVRVGVHAWTDGKIEPTDLPKNDEQHQSYIDAYVTVGHSKAWAKEFYFFTINSAPSSDIHWMQEEEFEHFGIFTDE